MRRVLIAGIGNVFLGDDAFGVEVVTLLETRSLPPGIEVVDFGTCGFDLAMALSEPWAAAILVDACPRGETPGTLYLLDLREVRAGPGELPQGHGLDPVRVLSLLAQLGIARPPLYLLGCEPGDMVADEDEPAMCPAVRAAVQPACYQLEDLARSLLREEEGLKGNEPTTTTRAGAVAPDRSGRSLHA